MNTTKSIFASLVLILLVAVSTMAQTEAKVIAVVNKADWCHVCEENGARAMAAFMANNKDQTIQFIGNDLTNDETKAKSLEELKKVGLADAVAELKFTGIAYFFNTETKMLITQVSVAKTDAELAEVLLHAKKRIVVKTLK